MGDDIMISLRNLEECSKFLWGEPGGEKVRRSVDRLTEIFQVERGTMRPIIVRGAWGILDPPQIIMRGGVGNIGAPECWGEGTWDHQ